MSGLLIDCLKKSNLRKRSNVICRNLCEGSSTIFTMHRREVPLSLISHYTYRCLHLFKYKFLCLFVIQQILCEYVYASGVKQYGWLTPFRGHQPNWPVQDEFRLQQDLFHLGLTFVGLNITMSCNLVQGNQVVERQPGI